MESSCQICNAKSEDIYCSLCNIIVPHVLGHRYNIIYKKEYIDKIRDKIGFTSMKPQHIWEKIRKLESYDKRFTNWWTFTRQLSFMLDEGLILSRWKANLHSL